jgi:activator of HSP90 ATPase
VSKRNRRRRKGAIKKNRGSSLVIPVVVGVVLLALLAGAIIALESGQSASAGDSSAQVNTAQALNTGSMPYPGVPRITLQETQDKLEQDQAVLVDVRSKAAYDGAHAAGAVSLPEGEITSRLDELPRDKEIILYCT